MKNQDSIHPDFKSTNHSKRTYSMKYFKTGVLIFLFLGFLSCQSPKDKQDNNETQNSPTPDQAKETNTPDNKPAIAFHEAAMTGNRKAVNAHIQNGADVNATNTEGHTPLMLAAYNGHTKIVEKLLKNGASVSITDNKNLTPLHFAASGPFPETVKLLIEHDADVNAIDNIENFTPLMYAASEGNAEVVRILLEHGADTSMKDEDGDDAETFARQGNHQEVIKVFEAQ